MAEVRFCSFAAYILDVISCRVSPPPPTSPSPTPSLASWTRSSSAPRPPPSSALYTTPASSSSPLCSGAGWASRSVARGRFAWLHAPPGTSRRQRTSHIRRGRGHDVGREQAGAVEA
ncbi:hypothetical protein C8R45DRAFT_1221606 [Mycena sanguinolenta]|nr:hypothetical protein C8R45DRAFT_1221606 [Mycena sanguinolenta]